MNDRKRCLLSLSVVAYFVMMGSTIISPILPIYALTFEVSLAMVGGLISGYGLARLMLDVPTGMVSDRVGMKRFMMIGLLIVMVGAITSGSATSYWMLLGGRVTEGMGSAIYTTTSYTCMGRIAPKEERGKYMSFYLGLLLLGMVSGPGIGGYVAEFFGLSAPFFFYAGCVLFSLALVLVGVSDAYAREVSGRGEVSLLDLKSLLKNYTFASINVAIFTIFVVRMGIVATLVPVFAIYNIGMTESTLGLVLTLSALLNFITMLPAGPLTDEYGRKRFMFSSLFLTGVFVILIPFTHDLFSFAVVMAGLGFALGLSGPIMAWVTDISRPEQIGTAMGVFRTMSDAGFVVGPLLLTAIAGPVDQPLGLLPFVAAGLTVVGASILLIRTRDPIRE